MDKKDSSFSSYNHTITMVERKSFVTSGVKKIENFDDNQFLLDTVMGFLLVKGEELELIKLDTLQGTITIKGLINSLTYLDDSNKKEKENSIFNRLFK
ncbi:MAG: sporulation protein YabP [Bacilli bacterium]|nr:sporulation protein YabP [Bacilli bacterium]